MHNIFKSAALRLFKDLTEMYLGSLYIYDHLYLLHYKNWFEKVKNGVSTVVRKQISFLFCELFIPAFYTFLKYGFLSLVVRKYIWMEN